MCFSSGTSAPVNPAPYSLQNSYQAVQQTVKDAPATTGDSSSSGAASTSAATTTNTSASGMKLPGMTM